MMNIDIVRNALTFDTVEDLTSTVNHLHQSRELVERPANVELLDKFKEASPWNPNEPWCRWRRHAHLAVDILKGRQKMHLLYKVYRASDQYQLYQDFKPKEREKRTWRW